MMAEHDEDKTTRPRKGARVRVRWPAGELSGQGWTVTGEGVTLSASHLEEARKAAQAAGVELIEEEG